MVLVIQLMLMEPKNNIGPHRQKQYSTAETIGFRTPRTITITILASTSSHNNTLQSFPASNAQAL